SGEGSSRAETTTDVAMSGAGRIRDGAALRCRPIERPTPPLPRNPPGSRRGSHDGGTHSRRTKPTIPELAHRGRPAPSGWGGRGPSTCGGGPFPAAPVSELKRPSGNLTTPCETASSPPRRHSSWPPPATAARGRRPPRPPPRKRVPRLLPPPRPRPPPPRSSPAPKSSPRRYAP